MKHAELVKLSDISFNTEFSSHRGEDDERVQELRTRMDTGAKRDKKWFSKISKRQKMVFDNK